MISPVEFSFCLNGVCVVLIHRGYVNEMRAHFNYTDLTTIDFMIVQPLIAFNFVEHLIQE